MPLQRFFVPKLSDTDGLRPCLLGQPLVLVARGYERVPTRCGALECFTRVTTWSDWSALSSFEPYTCPITLEELKRIADPRQREQLLNLAGRLSLLDWTQEMETFAQGYVSEGTFSPA